MHGNRRSRDSQRESVYPERFERERNSAKVRSLTIMRNARRRGWFIKNYSTNQVIIDREHFNPGISYSIAKQVFWKSFSLISTCFFVGEV